MPAIKRERHQAADDNYGEADNHGEDDTDPRSHVAGHRYRHVGGVPPYIPDIGRAYKQRE